MIKKTAEFGYNLIITHEPTFYSHFDSKEPVGNYKVFREKMDLIESHGIAIWRDHDHLHAHKPDGIFYGVMKELGWAPYLVGDGDRPRSFKFPRTTVRKLALEIKEKMGLNMVRMIGNPDDEVETLAFGGHVFPGENENRQFDIFEKEDIDVMIPGELIDWTVASYVRDAYQLGHHKAILAIGHYNGENLGMKYAPVWISEVIKNAVPVVFVEAGDMYRYV